MFHISLIVFIDYQFDMELFFDISLKNYFVSFDLTYVCGSKCKDFDLYFDIHSLFLNLDDYSKTFEMMT